MPAQRRKYEPDCGTRDVKFLSYRAAIQTRKYYRPGEPDARGERRSYGLCADFGAHQCQLCQRRGCAVERRPLVKYGIGVDLYFKGLKALACCSLAAALLALPAVAAFWTGARDPAAARDAVVRYDPLAALFYTSLGSWGEHTVVCGEAAAGALELACPAGSEIVAAFAYWGEPTGFCSCPESHQLDAAGGCPGAARSADACEDEPCFAGTTNYGDACCARRVDGRGGADFDGDVHPAAAPGCDSATARYVVQGLCLGRANCTLPAAGEARVSWQPRSADTGCGGYRPRGGGACRLSLGQDGRFGGCGNATRLLATAFCGRPRLSLARGRLRAAPTREAASYALSLLDALGAAVLLGTALWLSERERAAGRLYKKYVCTPADYTVALDRWSLPPGYESLDELAQLLRSHFEHALGAAAPVARPGPVRVADVNFAVNNRRMIRLMKDRGALARRIDRLDARATILRARDAAGCCRDRRLQALDLRNATLRSRFDALQRQLKEMWSASRRVRAVAAYVTFESEEGCLRCLQSYPPALRGWFQRRELRLGGRPVALAQAEEPRNLYWENLGLRASSRLARRAAVAGCFGLLLLATSGVVYWADRAQQDFSARFPTPDCFPYQAAGAILYDPADPRAYAPTASSTELSMADVARDWLPEAFGAETGDTGLVECFCLRVMAEEGLGDMLDYEFAAGAPANRTAYEQHDGKWCAVWARRKARVYTVASAAVAFIVFVEFLMEALAEFLTERERHPSRTQQARSLVTKLAAASVVNTGLLVLLVNGNLNAFPGLSRHASSGVRGYGLLGGGYDDFGSEWYATVGSAVVQALGLSWASDLACYAYAYAAHHWARFADGGCTGDHGITHQLTQAGLNRVHTGPAMKFEVRYAALTKFVVVATLFSAGLPLLNVLLFLVVASQYLLDKFLFSKFYATPETLTNALALVFSTAIPPAVAARSVVAAWMWTNPGLVGRSSGYGDMAVGNSTAYSFFADEAPKSAAQVVAERLGHRNAAPHVAILIMLALGAAGKIINWFLTELGVVRDGVAGLLAKCGCCDAEAFFADLIAQSSHGFPDYFRALSTATLERRVAQKVLKKAVLREYARELDARRRGRVREARTARGIQGLETYDFRCNPAYVAKFALDSRTIQLADAADVGSLRGSGLSADEEAADDFGAAHHAFLPRAADHAPPGGYPQHDDHYERRRTIWVEEAEPGPDALHAYAAAGGLHHGHGPAAVGHDHAWHRRWAADDAAERSFYVDNPVATPRGVEMRRRAPRDASPEAREMESPDHSPIHSPRGR